MVKIKICGMKNPDNIADVAKLSPDFMGFIFYPKSPRFMANTLSVNTIELLSPEIIKTGVFVNETLDQTLDYALQFKLNALQLHGSESPEMCNALSEKGFTVIKAFSIDETFNFDTIQQYENAVDYYLFDTKSPKHGGTGVKFDWEILKRYDNSKPIFLSGGIDSGDEEAIGKLSFLNIFALDLNSRFEIEPGVKNIEQLKIFIRNIKK